MSKEATNPRQATAAENILRDLRGQRRLPFRYIDRGIMATIGHHRAVAEFGNKRLPGLIAWLMWSVVHVFLLIGFRNRVAVMLQWIWAYLTREGSSPLITDHQRTVSGMIPAGRTPIHALLKGSIQAGQEAGRAGAEDRPIT